MPLDDLRKQDQEILLDENTGLSTVVIYNPPTGSAITFRGIFEEDQSSHLERQIHQEKMERRATVDCPRTIDNAPVVFDPEGSMEIKGETWMISGFPSKDDWWIEVDLVKPGYKHQTGRF